MADDRRRDRSRTGRSHRRSRPALADAGLPANILAGFHHDHLLVPHDRAQHAVVVLENLRHAPVGRRPASPAPAALPVDALTVASGLVSRLLVPEIGPVLVHLHQAGTAGCTDRELLDAVPGEPRVVLGLVAALIEAGVAESSGGRTRMLTAQPPELAATLRRLAAGPLTVPRHLSGCLDNGRIVRYPRNDDDLGELLARVVELIGAGTVHSEASLTAALAAIAEPAELRRRLVDHGLVERTPSGSRYVVRATV
jgi:hypothetical protein